MNGTTRCICFLLIGFFSAFESAAAGGGADSTDPLAALDLNRTVIVADIVAGFRADIERANPGGSERVIADLTATLNGLRADRLLAASIASSYAGLQSILLEAQTAGNAARTRASQKAFGDLSRDLIYTPLTPCRLIDTRGFGAPIQGGAFAPNSRRSYVPNGLCGIPLSGVASMIISFTTENLTPNSGGYLAILAPGAPVTTTVDVFNLGAEWSASNTTIATGSAGQFDVFVSTANAQVVVDILGYFSPPSSGSVGTVQLADGAITTVKILDGAVTATKLATSLSLAGTTTGTFSGPLTGNVTGNVSGNAGTATKLAAARNINGVPFDGTTDISLPATVVNGCPGARIGGTCLLSYSNAQATNFATAAQACANQGGDICTDSQQWPLFSQSILSGPHWTASFADNDATNWSGANGGTGDDHAPTSTYGYACCGGCTPAFASATVTTTASVQTTLIHDVADTTFAGAVAQCAAMYSDICSDSQTLRLRGAGALTVATWTNSHADNDASLYNAINGGTTDDTNPAQLYGFACCPSRRPSDLSCPVARTNGVCAISIHNTADATFAQAAVACTNAGGDLCSISQSAVLRSASALTVASNWTNSHSDNDSTNASVGVGAMSDNPNLSTPAGYACCLN